MSKDEGKALAKKGDESAMSIPGTMMPEEMEQFIAGGGFASIETLMIGETKGKIPMYVGELLGPGAEVEVTAPDETVNKLPTWSFHPITKSGTVENVTHVIPAAHQLHAALDRVWKQAQTMDKTAIVGIMTSGKTETRKGRQLNTFRVFEKYVTKKAG